MAARRSRGAALLMAMMIVALVSTMAAAMVWQQWRAVQVEKAERARRQSDWILTGALDWARLILREDAKSGGPDHLGEPWAVPLAEARLSTFLAADKNNTDVDLEAFLSGNMTDAQSRYNLLNLVNKEGAIDPKELAVVKNLFDNINVPRELADVIAKSLQGGIPATPAPPPPPGAAPSGPSTNPGALAPIPIPVNPNPTVLPHSLMQLAWFGLDPDTLRRIEPFVTLLPSNGPPTTVNLNTASREVLAAVIDGLDLGTAERLIQTRQRNPFKSLADAKKQLPDTMSLNPNRVGFQSRFFETRGRMRLEDRVLEQRTVVQRFGNDVKPIFHELVNVSTGP